MSHYMTALAMRQTGLKPATKIVLYWLADHHNGETGLCCPGVDRLAYLSEMHRTAVMRHIKTLEECGLVSRQKRFKSAGIRTSDTYVLHLSGDTKSQNATATKSQNAHDQVAKCDRNLGRVTLEDNTHAFACDADASQGKFWDDCSLVLMRSGITERQARSMLGKWGKTQGRDKIKQTINDAADVPDPVAYVTKVLGKPGGSTIEEIDAIRKEMKTNGRLKAEW